MTVILRNSTRRMVDQSRASVETKGFISWLRAEGYIDYVIDCHISGSFWASPTWSIGCVDCRNEMESSPAQKRGRTASEYSLLHILKKSRFGHLWGALYMAERGPL